MKLNLGVGREAREGWVNVDWQDYPGVNVRWDLNVTPWPFNDGSFDEILAFDIMEHLTDFTSAMDECWRVLQPSGLMTIRGPMAGGPNHHDDPTHVRGFTERSLNYYCPGTQLGTTPLLYGTGRWELKRSWTGGANIHYALRRLP